MGNNRGAATDYCEERRAGLSLDAYGLPFLNWSLRNSTMAAASACGSLPTAGPSRATTFTPARRMASARRAICQAECGSLIVSGTVGGIRAVSAGPAPTTMAGGSSRETRKTGDASLSRRRMSGSVMNCSGVAPTAARNASAKDSPRTPAFASVRGSTRSKSIGPARATKHVKRLESRSIRVGTVRLGQVVVQSHPGRQMSAGGAAYGRDAVRIDVPVLGLGADKLHGPDGILHLGGKRMFRREAIVNADHGNAGIEDRFDEVALVDELALGAAPPAAAVNLDQDRRRPGGLDQIGIQPLDVRVRLAVDDVAVDRQTRIAGKRQIRGGSGAAETPSRPGPGRACGGPPWLPAGRYAWE